MQNMSTQSSKTPFSSYTGKVNWELFDDAPNSNSASVFHATGKQYGNSMLSNNARNFGSTPNLGPSVKSAAAAYNVYKL